jgi:AbrB family looped-hinge helix DNA binding protein
MGMETVSVSPKFQVVIPKRIREALGLKPGQKMQALQYGDRVELIPLVPLASARGVLKGLATDIERERDRA